jgi:hypothetical protein
MANTARVSGLHPVGSIIGAPFNGRVTRYAATDTNALYVGSVVKLDGTASTDSYLRGVTQITATTDVPCGVVVGFEPLRSNLNLPNSYKEANGTDRVVYVADDPNTLFWANCTDGLDANDVGLNISLATFTGSTTTGLSNTVADGATEATTDSLICRVVGFLESPDNDPEATNSKVVLKFIRHKYLGDVAASAGV